jgi:inner membrane protein
MPSPVGHLIAGAAIAWAVEALPSKRPKAADPASRPPGLPLVTPLVVACSALALAPDVDILMAAHRTYTHSAGSVILVACVAGVAAHALRRPAVLTALACAAAVGSHIVLDWLGHDGTAPIGVMALWPFTAAYFYSGVDLFADVSRRYWKPDEFILGNAWSIVRELLILLPPAGLAWLARRRRQYL